MQTIYSKTFKIEAVKKVLSRTPGTPVTAIARSLGVSNSTLHGWIEAMKNKELRESPASGGLSEKILCRWTAEEKFKAIIDTSTMSSEQRSEYCREQGIFPHHLEKWKADFIDSANRKAPKADHATKQLKNEIKNLNVELRRKEKALAEAAALLILKKKAEILWKTGEVD